MTFEDFFRDLGDFASDLGNNFDTLVGTPLNQTIGFGEGALFGYQGPMWDLGQFASALPRAMGVWEPPTGEPLIGIPRAEEWAAEQVGEAKAELAEIRGTVGGLIDEAKDTFEGILGTAGEMAASAQEQLERIISGAGAVVTPVVDLVESVSDAVKGFEMPEIHLPDMPEIHMPEIHMPEIHMPEIRMPEMKIPETLPIAAAAVGIVGLLIFGGVL